jgi:hypothetical protein
MLGGPIDLDDPHAAAAADPDKRTRSYVVPWNAFKRIAVGFSAEEKAALVATTAAAVFSPRAAAASAYRCVIDG